MGELSHSEFLVSFIALRINSVSKKLINVVMIILL